MKNRPRVRVYTTPTCPFCVMAKIFLRQHGVEFEEIDVAENRDAAREMVMKSGQTGVPVLDIDGEIIVGFDREAIKKALKLA